MYFWGFPGGSVVKKKKSARNAGDTRDYLGQEDPLEKEIATHSSILGWKIPWTEEASGLQSMWFQRVEEKHKYIYMYAYSLKRKLWPT